MEIAPLPVTRRIPLRPGVRIDQTEFVEATVKLLTRGEQSAIFKLPEAERVDAQIARVIHSLHGARGIEQTDRGIIASVIDALAVVDADRILSAAAELEQEYTQLSPAGPPVPLPRIPGNTEIISDAFELNPGIQVGGEKITTCRVRLLTRGEWRQLDSETDPQARLDLELLNTIVQLGGSATITIEHVQALTLPDCERINSQVEALRAQYAPETKRPTECPACGFALEG
jgi:hypothetical protein